MPRIQAIVVLYNMRFADSSCCVALQSAFSASPEFAASVDLIVADNSAHPQALPPGARGAYLHDGTNPGLARRYNQALAAAVAQGAAWLLLLDQDTNLNPAYIAEALELSRQLELRPEIAIVVPKLRMDGHILSPHAPLYRRSDYVVDRSSFGVFPASLRAFNSGALVRVAALQAIGGFPEEYWLDYLDHATFHRIQQRSGSIFVMHSLLEHELSGFGAAQPQNPARLANKLRAEERFYREHGSFVERMGERVDLFRQVIGWGRRGHFEQALVRLKVLLRIG